MKSAYPLDPVGLDSPSLQAQYEQVVDVRRAIKRGMRERWKEIAAFRLIETARTVELMAFSPDVDPLALVRIAKPEALDLIAMPATMGHVFRASHVGKGRVFVGAVRR